MNDNPFARECQTWLDARRPLPADNDPVWARWPVIDRESNLATLASYRQLQNAIAQWASPPAFEASESLVATLSMVPRPLRRSWHPARWAAAAALILTGVVGLRGFLEREPAPVAAVRASSRPLNLAFLQATEATLQLARATGEPAARVGRTVFESPEWTSNSTAFLPPISIERASGALLGVGQRVGEGVRPLGGSARKAFGFLVAPVSSGSNPPMPAKPATASDLIL